MVFQVFTYAKHIYCNIFYIATFSPKTNTRRQKFSSGAIC